MTRLAERLRAHGLADTVPVVLHANRRVLVTLTSGGALRVHEGYEAAPDAVVAAIAQWARPRVRRSDRLRAQRILVAFPIHTPDRPPSPQRPREQEFPEHCARLLSMWVEHNAQHFAGTLEPAEISVSRRMKRRLGEFRPAPRPGGRPRITIALGHIRRNGWAGVSDTLLHEMVHQWQDATGRPLRHGREFRKKCAELGIDGRAVARVATDVRRYLISLT